MYKTLCVAILFLPTFALTQGTKSASAGAFISPQIVAKGKLPNHTAPIPTTTIFTPTQTGLYRMNAYATLTVSDPNSQASWCLDVNWTDDSGTAGGGACTFQNSSRGPFDWNGTGSGGVLVFEDKAGVPITYNVLLLGGPPDNTAYSLYYTLERLE
jgi:hypothetical protein